MEELLVILNSSPVVLRVAPSVEDVASSTVAPAAEPQLFHARVTISGDGSPLDARDVYLLVPARVDGPGGPM